MYIFRRSNVKVTYLNIINLISFTYKIDTIVAKGVDDKFTCENIYNGNIPSC